MEIRSSEDSRKEFHTCCDIMVAGATPAGIMAASGPGKSDLENKMAIEGLFREFTGRIFDHYVSLYGKEAENTKLCQGGFYYEPSVAEHVFREMISEVKPALPSTTISFASTKNETAMTGKIQPGVKNPPQGGSPGEPEHAV